MQPLVAVLVAGRDAVEVVLHARREPVVDEPAEVLLEQVDDGEGEERRHERSALLEDIAAVEDRADDRGVRRRAADAELLERAHERRFGVARRRVRLVTLRLELDQLDGTTLGQIRQAALVVVGLLVGVATFLVRGEEAAERNHRAGGAELRLLAAVRCTGDAQRNGLTLRILHLRRDRADPDQLVQRVLIAVELSLHVLRRAERVARRANRLVRLLRVLHLALVPPRLPVVPEVPALREPLAVHRDEPRFERVRLKGRLDVPPAGGPELAPLAFALDDKARRNRLDAPGGQAAHDLLPEHRRDLVAVETVEDAPGLLRIDEPFVDLARLFERAGDRVLRDLVEDHATHRHLRPQDLEQVPGDRLALAVFVRRQQELVGLLQELLQLADLLLLVGIDDVERLEVVLDIDAEARPLLLLVFLRDVGGALGQVADVADARLDDEIVAEIALDRPCLGGRLDDHQAPVPFLRSHRRVTIAGRQEVEYPPDAAKPLLQPRRRRLLAHPLRPLPPALRGARAAAAAGRVRPRLQPRLEPRSLAAGPADLAETVPAV